MTRARTTISGACYNVASEEELKNLIAQDWFGRYDCTKILGCVDFSVYPKVSEKYTGLEITPFYWAEVKRDPQDIYKAVTQLILTIGKERTFDKHLPPFYVGAFDSEKIAFVPYNDIQDFFYTNDFNWNVKPSDHNTKEFQMVYERVKSILDGKTLLFYYNEKDQLNAFIKENFYIGRTQEAKIKIDRNNFVIIYQRWLEHVKPSIAIDWDKAKKAGIIDGDFYLADLLSEKDSTILDNLHVVLRVDHYEMMKRIDETGLLDVKKAFFNDGQKKYREFWAKYERPPKEEYWDYIIQRRDLLVPQDVRERKGSFFTPKQWVELSQEYLARAFGENWQEEYYVWDCAAGTGNLLNGLVDKYRIWASTLDQQDVDTMHERINNGANLLKDHVFQFDFLNDEWKPRSQGGKMPDNLYRIITDPEQQKKLIIYINPPYAEATSIKTVAGTGTHKAGVSTNNDAYKKYRGIIGKASNELFALFITQIYDKMPNCKIAFFAKPKFIQGTSFTKFRDFFLAAYKCGFAVPANTFDNVSGEFPIVFTIWDCSIKQRMDQIKVDIYDRNGKMIGQKTFLAIEKDNINRWISRFNDRGAKDIIAYLACPSPDFSSQKFIFIGNNMMEGHFLRLPVNVGNLIPACIYFAVRHCIKSSWPNDKDQLYYPRDSWKQDIAFQSDCIIFTLFHSQNRISFTMGDNYWIPFSEKMVNARAKFTSDFMWRFLNGDWGQKPTLFSIEPYRVLDYISPEAQKVYEVGLKLWRYYHSQPDANPDASFYDIKVYFKGRTPDGRVKQKSSDATFNAIMDELREAMNALAEKIAEKAYEHGFLIR